MFSSNMLEPREDFCLASLFSLTWCQQIFIGNLSLAAAPETLILYTRLKNGAREEEEIIFALGVNLVSHK